MTTTPRRRMTDSHRWTHAATLTRPYRYGARQSGKVAASGSRVILVQDPAQQEGDLITFKYGTGTGVARLTDLVDITAIA